VNVVVETETKHSKAKCNVLPMILQLETISRIRDNTILKRQCFW
jgi:hypothetical protein